MVRASSIESSTMTAPSARNRESTCNRSAATCGIDFAALRGEQQRTAHRAEALDRHGDQHDDLAALVGAHGTGLLSGECLHDFRVTLAVGRPEVAVQRIAATPEPILDGDPCALEARRPVVGRNDVEAQYVAAAVKVARVDLQRAVAVIDAGLRARRLHEAAQHRRDALQIDREFERGERLVLRPVALAGLQFEQLVGIDGDRVGLDRSRRPRSRSR
jgi:hypothetical protein